VCQALILITLKAVELHLGTIHHSVHVPQVLQEAVHADEPPVHEGRLAPEAQELLEELRERQQMVVEGGLDLEASFDDFRIVLGQNTL
jgi:hypothetical protein